MRPLLVVPALFGTALSVPGEGALWGRFKNFYRSAPVACLGRELPGCAGDVIKAFAILPGLRYDVLGALERALVTAGYRPGETLFFFAYDWRHRIADVGPLLASAIRELAQRRGEDVDLLGLSNGGLVLRAALAVDHQLPVGAVVTSGAPHAGSVEALACLHAGFQFAPLGRRLAPEEFLACPGSLDCLPPPGYELFLPSEGSRAAERDDLYDVDTWIERGIAVFRRRRADDVDRWRPIVATRLAQLKETWDLLALAPPPRRLTCVVGKGLPTQARVPIQNGTIVVPGEGHVAALAPAALEEGDGGVTLTSGTRWEGQATRVLKIPVGRHRDVVRTPAAFAAILAGLAPT
jgi:hypothetical protein